MTQTKTGQETTLRMLSNKEPFLLVSTRVRSCLVVAIICCLFAANVTPIFYAQTDSWLYLPLVRMTATVTTTEDELNSDGDCSLREAIQTVNTNHMVDHCSMVANIIVLSAGTYTLTLPGGSSDDDNTVGDLDITGTLTIQGVGTSSPKINGNKIDRVFQIHPNSHVTFTNITIENGRTHNGVDNVAPERGGNADPGGGIANAGVLTLIGSAVISNTTGNGGRSISDYPQVGGGGGDGGNGGGIYNAGVLSLLNNSAIGDNTTGNGGNDGHRSCDGFAGIGGGLYNTNEGQTMISGSTIRNNHTGVAGSCHVFVPIRGLKGGSGGGIENFGVLTLKSSLISGNSTGSGTSVQSSYSCGGAEGNGGGISNRGILTADNISLDNNYTGNGGNGGDCGGGRGGHGGGLYNEGDAFLVASQVIANHLGTSGRGPVIGGSGGGIYNEGRLYLERSTVSHNQAGAGSSLPHNGLYNTNGTGGGIFNTHLLTMTMSAIYENFTVDGRDVDSQGVPTDGGNGGGIVNLGGLYLVNSTISGNYTGDGGSGGTELGGASGNGAGILNNGWLTMTHSTVANNYTGLGGSGLNGNNEHGGAGAGIYNSRSVLMRSTILANNSATGDGPDCYGMISSYGYNLVGQPVSCTLTLELTTNILDQAPALAPLADNNGQTQTHALLAASPAIDTGNCTDITGNVIPSDQRGVARPQRAACDIGAFEAE